MDIQFQYKAFLPLFAVILILSLFYFAWLLWKKQVRKRIGDAGLVNELTEGYSPHSSLLKFAVLMLAFGLGVIALMNPRRPGADESTTRKGIDIAIALDVSKSMLAADLAPNRLERAKQFINKLMASMPDDRIALVLFAGRAYLQMPLTTDHGAAGIFVSAAGPSSVPQQGTVISEALKRASSVFPSRTNTYKSIILISDGEDHDEDAVSAAKDLSEQGVMINTVGIGSPEGTNIIDPLTGEEKKDDAGNPVISKLNEKILIDVAAATNGIYTKLENSDQAVNILNAQLAQIGRSSFRDLSRANFKSFYWWLAAAMFLLLVVEIFINENRRKGIKKPAKLKGVVTAIFLMFAGFSYAQNKQVDEALQKGNQFYKEQKFVQAAEQYAQVLNSDPSNVVAKFNHANSLFKQDNKVEAVQLFSELATGTNDKSLQNRSWYNKGVILSNQKNTVESIEAYKNALRNDPTDIEARENLQKALLELKKENQDKKNQKQQPPPKKDQQKNQSQSKMQPKEAEQRLRLLQQKEREVQERVSKEKTKTGGSQQKDW